MLAGLLYAGLHRTVLERYQDSAPAPDDVQALVALVQAELRAGAFGAGGVLALSLVGVLVLAWAIRRWPPRAHPASRLPAERLLGGTLAGLRYARHSQTLLAQLVRTAATLTAASFPDSQVTLAAAGLDRPVLRVKAERLDGSGGELMVGRQGADNLYFAKAADRDWIYKIYGTQVDMYYKDLLSLKAETPPPVAPSDSTSAGRPGGSG